MSVLLVGFGLGFFVAAQLGPLSLFAGLLGFGGLLAVRTLDD
jgi:hypothetical protein